MNTEEILDMYYNQDLSTYAIAEKLGTYPGKIGRVIKKSGNKLKSARDAQLAAMKSGRNIHPTAGKKHDQQTKNKISDKIYNNWQRISDEDRQKRVDKAKLQWYNMTEEERKTLRDAAAEAVRKAAKEGSKMELFLLYELKSLGYDVIFHKHGLIVNTNLEVDLFIPSLSVAVEIDGPAHFEPIWGEDSLQKHIRSDAHKSGLLLSEGFVVIRIKHITRNLSEKQKRLALDSLIVVLDRIKESFPKKGDRYIELEVK